MDKDENDPMNTEANKKRTIVSYFDEQVGQTARKEIEDVDDDLKSRDFEEHRTNTKR